jgi:hypothetical protein
MPNAQVENTAVIITTPEFQQLTEISITNEINKIALEKNGGIKIELVAEMIGKTLLLIKVLNQNQENRMKQIEDKLDGNRRFFEAEFKSLHASIGTLAQLTQSQMQTNQTEIRDKLATLLESKSIV